MVDENVTPDERRACDDCNHEWEIVNRAIAMDPGICFVFAVKACKHCNLVESPFARGNRELIYPVDIQEYCKDKGVELH
jgi:hypothetical protein